MSKTEPLHTCPNCHRANFTAKGLKAHRCKPVTVTIEPEPVITLAPVLPKQSLIGTFTGLQTGLKADALSMKVKFYFLGLIVNELTEAFRLEHGETRGGDQKSQAVTFAAEHLKEKLETALDVSYMTCTRYRNFWQDCTHSDKHAKAVKALNGVWTQHVESLKLEAPKSGKSKGGKTNKGATALALFEPGKGFAEAVQGLLEEADDLGLHMLFEKPVKDVTPEGDTEPETPQRKNKLIAFWCEDLARRMSRNEFLRLPKLQRQQLADEWELALTKLKDTLTPKKGAKA